MKTTYKLAALVVAVVLAGCDQQKQSYNRTGDDTASGTEAQKESREGLNAPKPLVADDNDQLKPATPEVTPGQDIPAPQIGVLKDQSKPAAPGVKKDTPDETPAYDTETKDHFVTVTEIKLKDLDEKIMALGEKLEVLTADTYAKDALSSIRAKRTQMGTKFDELKQASQDGWTGFKAGCQFAMDELTRAYDEAKTKYDK